MALVTPGMWSVRAKKWWWHWCRVLTPKRWAAGPVAVAEPFFLHATAKTLSFRM